MRLKNFTYFFGFLIFPCISSNAQEENKLTEPPPPFQESKWAVGAGANISSINISRNYRENPYKIGLNLRATYTPSNLIRFTGEYYYTPTFNLDPTWSNIHNQVLGASLNFLAYNRTQDLMVYTITGLCLQHWRGYYTGQNDFSTAKLYYTPDSDVINNSLGMDVGLGFERAFPGFFVFGDFRYRFTRIDHYFGISDVAYNLGIKFSIFTPTKTDKGNKAKRHTHKNRFSDRYHWF